MRLKKPVEAIDKLRPFSAWPDYSMKEFLAFIDSLPDEFEILGPGEVAVKWPESASKKTLELLYQTYKNPYPIKFDRPIQYDEALSTVLHALAAIAPERKKSQVYIWKDLRGKYQVSAAGFFPRNEFGWVLVAGPIEIDD